MFNLPIGVDISNLIDDLRIISWEAEKILTHYSKELKEQKVKKDLVSIKENNEPVTLADIEVNDLIIKSIKERYEDVEWQLLSEENGIIRLNKSVMNSHWLWVLDPLDGTKDFIQGTNNYALHLALNYKNKPYLGIVLIPEKEELWISYLENVWCENKVGLRQEIKFSNKRKIEEMILVTSKNHNNQNLQKIIKALGFKESIIMGSIGCKVASILRGESDIYLSLSLPGKSSPKDWDFAAPESLLRSAGGSITNLENEELTYYKEGFKQEGFIIASNNKNNHKFICEEIKDILKKNNLYPFSYLI